MRRGFTLLEVVIALLVLELAVVGAVGVFTLASRTLARAERLERAAGLAEGVLDSLLVEAVPTDGSVTHRGGTVSWIVGATGEVWVVALGPAGDTLLTLASVLPPSTGAP